MIDKRKFFRHYVRDLTAIVSSAIVIGLLVLAAFAHWVAPHNPYDLKAFHLKDSLKPPCWMEGGSRSFLLGTDDQGRDILSTLIYGLRTSFAVSFSAVGLSFLIGSAVGLLAGFYGRWIDAIISRICDIMLSFPAFLMVLLFLGILKKSGWITMILAISAVYWVRYARVMRGNVFAEKNRDYIDAARSLGASNGRLIFVHLLPNCVSTLLVIAAVDLAIVIVLESTLSFLGAGAPLTTPSLGMMIASGYQFLYLGLWWVVAFPGFVLAVLVLTINLLGDWLRQELNPKIT